MRKESELTLWGFIAIIFIILFLAAIFHLFSLSTTTGPHHRAVCGTNLKGLGTAVTIYANDYEGAYPQLPGTGPWSKRLGFDYDLTNPNFKEGGAETNVSRTITASLYLLVREADVSPRSFICPESNLNQFDGYNPHDKDLVELWDFGPNPHAHVSYSYHNPYGQFPSHEGLSSHFALMADMSPWFNDGNIVSPGSDNSPPQVIQFANESTWKFGNSFNHELKAEHFSEGQHVLFADGHSAWELFPNVGVENDNIYTYWSAEENPTDQARQGGTAPTSRSAENDAQSETDSFLAI